MAPAVVLMSAALMLAGCARSDSLGAQQRAGDDKDYVAGDGSVTELGTGDRGNPVSAKGTTADGKPLDIATMRGGVVVLNVWYAACPPCRAEARNGPRPPPGDPQPAGAAAWVERSRWR